MADHISFCIQISQEASFYSRLSAGKRQNPPSLSLLWFAEHLLRNLAPERNACRRLVFQVVEALPLPTNCHDATVPPHFDSGNWTLEALQKREI
ncbi:hypothetical protein TgHK011_009119 [Trichoderma gracile]|nr:hypothetical protein TgHK011_009119 [Trichoderma gracile]